MFDAQPRPVYTENLLRRRRSRRTAYARILMTDLLKLILGILASRFKARATLEAENLVLRQQVNVLRRTNAEATAPQQYGSFSICLALSLVTAAKRRITSGSAQLAVTTH